MQAYIITLKALASNQNISQIDETSEIDVSIVKQLFERGLIDAIDMSDLEGNCYADPRININGAEWLESKITSTTSSTEDIVDVKPNFFGIGLNLNAAWKKWFKKT
jgi:exoribonuclease II